MTYLVYQITNKVNGKIYIGAHQGSLNSYWGSGKVIKRAIKKYGDSVFEKQILFECDSKEEMFAKERELVTPEFVARNDTYNMKEGGQSGGSLSFTDEAKEKIRQSVLARWKDPEYRKRLSDIHKLRVRHRGYSLSFETKKKQSESHKGRTFTAEHRRKIGEANTRRVWTEESKKKLWEHRRVIESIL